MITDPKFIIILPLTFYLKFGSIKNSFWLISKYVILLWTVNLLLLIWLRIISSEQRGMKLVKKRKNWFRDRIEKSEKKWLNKKAEWLEMNPENEINQTWINPEMERKNQNGNDFGIKLDLELVDLVFWNKVSHDDAKAEKAAAEEATGRVGTQQTTQISFSARRVFFPPLALLEMRGGGEGWG